MPRLQAYRRKHLTLTLQCPINLPSRLIIKSAKTRASSNHVRIVDPRPIHTPGIAATRSNTRFSIKTGTLRVLPETELLKPVRNLLHRAPVGTQSLSHLSRD